LEKSIFEVRTKVYVLKEISKKTAQQVITSYVDEVLAKNPVYLEMHNQNKFKPYSFDCFFPVEKEGIYAEGKVYQFRVRALTEELGDYLLKELPRHETEYLKGLVSEIHAIKQKPIEKVFTVTPIVLKTKGYWKNNGTSFDQFEKLIRTNLIKKYKQWTNEDLDENFILYNSIQLLNSKPISIAYKNIHLLGDKVEIMVANNETAQNLMFMSIATGLGTMNSRGFGMVNYRYL